MKKEEKIGIVIGCIMLVCITIGWVAHEPEPCSEVKCEKCQEAWCFDLLESGPNADEQNEFLNNIVYENQSLNWTFFPCIKLTDGWYFCQNEDESGKYFIRYGCKGKDNKGFVCGESQRMYKMIGT